MRQEEDQRIENIDNTVQNWDNVVYGMFTSPWIHPIKRKRTRTYMFFVNIFETGKGKEKKGTV